MTTFNDYSEKDFQADVRRLAALYHWQVYCTLDSRHSPPGWPDLTLVRPPDLMFRELKTDKGRLTPPQIRTLRRLRQCSNLTVHLWRPADTAEINSTLGAPLPTEAPHCIDHKHFQQAIRRTADDHGWETYCTWRSKGSPPGWPDLVLVRPPDLVIAELKIPPDRPNPAQRATLDLLSRCHRISADVWRPAQMQQIADLLATPQP